jgi:hypothetical protein
VAGNLSRRLHVWDLRLIRQRLAAMSLDWELPPCGHAVKHDRSSPLKVEAASSARAAPSR